MKIKKGDKVLVIAGKDRGKSGAVEVVLRKKGTLVISDVNIATKHSRATRKNPKGGILKMPVPMDPSKVMLLCPKCDKPTRVGYLKGKAGKERLCKRCKQVIG